VRIAIIGAGISGNVCARLLAEDHDVDLYDANGYAGGHTNTVPIEAFGRTIPVDTGFMVFNHRTYPNFTRLLHDLNIESQASDMSFSVRCERSGLEYQGSSLNGLFAQRSNLFRPSFYGMLRDILRFNRESLELLAADDDRLTIGEYLQQNAYSRRFTDHYLIPMGAAIWSARPTQFFDFPARSLVAFFRNHGLLSLRNRPQWRTIPGGARRYVSALLHPLADRLRLNAPVQKVLRSPDHVLVVPQGAMPVAYDRVVFATHADQTLRIIGDDLTDAEREVLGAFSYQRNEAVVHTDSRLLPRRRRAWASWNYHIPKASDQPVGVTYDVNRLQRLGAPEPICVTLNHTDRIDASKIHARIEYYHPVFAPGSMAAQRRHDELNGANRTFFCGAYWGYGFHEDGVNSALAVAKHFGKDLETWKAASTKDASSIAVGDG
jgi:predicted NAD/FAD-binding protein